MKKILILASWYPANNADATGRFIAAQAESLATIADVRVVDCTQKFMPLPLRWRHKVQSKRILKSCNQSGWTPDLIHAHIAYPAGLIGLELQKHWSVPVILTEHTGPLELLVPYFKSKNAFYSHFNRYDRVLAVSSFQRQCLLSGGELFPVGVVGNMIRPPFFEAALRSPLDQATAVVVAPFTKEKGLLFLLEAMKSYDRRPTAPSFSLTLMGMGPLKKQWEIAAPHFQKTKIHFRDPGPSSAVIESIQGASFLLLPSEVETFSIVAAEALALGRPVLGRQCGGPADFVSETRGLLLEGSDPVAFAQQIENFAKDLQWRGNEQNLQIRRDYIQQNFSSEAITAQLRQIYSSL